MMYAGMMVCPYMQLHSVPKKRVLCTDLFRIENAKQVVATAMHTATTAAVSS